MKLSRTIFLSVFAAAFAVNFPAQAAILALKTEATLDVSNLFDHGRPANYRQFGVPDQIAHPYALRISYRFPLGISSVATRTQVPERENCWGGGDGGGGGCETIPAHLEAKLGFRDPEFKVVFELIDNSSGTVVGIRTEPMKLNYVLSLFHGEEPRFEGIAPIPPVEREQGDLNSTRHVSFPLVKGDSKHFVLEFQEMYAFEGQRFENAKVEIERAGQDTYRLKSVRLDLERAQRTDTLTGPTLDIDYQKYHQYFGVGGLNYPYANYRSEFRSLTTE